MTHKVCPKFEQMITSICPDEDNDHDHKNSNAAETFTIWMKSLVCHSNGCTVYDSKGNIVYRVDNYGRKCSNQVLLMDLNGTVLYIIRKKLLAFGRWDGYRCGIYKNHFHKEKPRFRVRRCSKSFLTGRVVCEITVGCDKYRILRSEGKHGFSIVDKNKDTIAEAKQKQSSSGLALGDDVLALEVKPGIDHSLVMAFITVYGLICRKM